MSPVVYEVGGFDVATQDRGSDWVDLAADQHTLFYTSEGTEVKRFDVGSNTQLPDFSSALPALGEALRLTGTGVLVATQSEAIVRLDGSGNVAQTYTDPTGGGEADWNALTLDRIPHEARGTLLGLVAALQGVGLALGPSVGGTLWESASHVAQFMAAAAALSLGATRWRTFRAVTLPLTLPGVAGGFLLAFALAISAYATADVKEDAMAAGCAEVFAKPLDVESLLGRIKATLGS